MTKPRDAYWDELGLAWSAIETENSAIVSALQSRLRRQSLMMTAGLVMGIPLTLAGFLLGAMTIWKGWASATWNFLMRGFAIEIISVIAARALWGLLPVRSSRDGEPLSEILALAVIRSQRTLATTRMALAACAIAAVFGLIGTVIRTAAGSPPAQSPVIDVGFLAIVALALALYLRQIKVNLAKFQYLKNLTSDSLTERGGK